MIKNIDKMFKDKMVIIFDFDGTLINSLPDITFSVNQMLSNLKRELVEERAVESWVGNGAEKLVERALAHTQSRKKEILSSSFINQALSIYLNYYRQTACQKTFAYPGVIDGLRKFKKIGFRLALVTNKPIEFIRPILAKLKIVNNDGGDLFEIILGGDSLSQKKPAALPLLYVCDQLNVTVNNCVMVGDSKNDILAAQNADMHNIGVTYGYNYGESIDSCEPDKICHSFEELVNVLAPTYRTNLEPAIIN